MEVNNTNRLKKPIALRPATTVQMATQIYVLRNQIHPSPENYAWFLFKPKVNCS